ADGVALANTEVAAPVRFLEIVVPVIVRAHGDVAEAVDLGADVVIDENGAAVPAEAIDVDLGIGDEVVVALSLDPLGATIKDDLSRAVPEPLKRAAIVGDAKVEYLTFLDQGQSALDGVRSDSVEGADLVVLAPDPAVTLPLDPALGFRLVRGFGRGRLF